ncbi:cobalt-zinc-cadmium efflux system protein [Geoalkalibacter ferrihydriticus]|uniref:Cation transporter n=2 Tax=Geoalkalibacter ferrihydriticus TaxID=392333 RepID=A0A0C2DWC5_9BACT|nr:cation diffusion facilitator family transporter [Geoalkalibacter ferrihydriticus]KIH77744.1 cation transporter [Geoalkalibacter ferrihydriticus DSM 17813]SDL76788.1 cobalt-zinc-cadmium efflux system protein [Geoalkalibacter ferrihydriticus]
MAEGNHFDRKLTKGFVFAIALTSVTFVAEVIGGLWTNSLALLSDAAHVFSDLFALALSLMAIKLASRPATDRRTYGWHRAEILASLINGATLLLMAVGILFEAWRRILDPQEVKSLEMFIIATVGLVMNLIVASRLHGHSHDDLNVRSAFLHVIGDAIASVGVILGGVVMLLTGWYVVDALVSVAIVLIIGFGALRIMRAAVHILLEGVPPHIDINEIVTKMRAVEGVNDVHHLHCWSICSHITSLSAHVDVEPQFRLRQGQIVGEIEEMLEHDYHITHTTLQCECSSCLSGPVIQQLEHRPRRSSLCSHGKGPRDHDHHHS